MGHYFYDENHIRYTLAGSGFGHPFNWLFIPGGPGGDSSYLLSIIELLDLPGNTWLIDLPGNGSNTVQDNYDYEEWFNLFIPMISKFENPIIVGHSFGGMFPLLFPQLEKLLQGFVILNAAPKAWLEEAARCAKLYNLPDLSLEMKTFYENPNEENFKIALEACIPYYFPAENLERGKKFLEKVSIQFRPSAWWSKKAGTQFNAVWIPQNVPTLILGGSHDSIAPFSIFEKDVRFSRNNIVMKKINQSGHFSWVDQPTLFKTTVMDFLKQNVIT